MLTQCTDCRHPVSTRASSCPGCGAPIVSNVPPTLGAAIGRPRLTPLPDRPVTIERTSKGIKLLLALATIAFWYGLYATVINRGSVGRAELGIVLCVLGAVVYLASKAARWWVNG